MKSSKPIAGRYLGYREADRATPYARFFNPALAPLAPHVCAALDRGGVPAILLPDIDQAASNLFGADPVLEDGFVLTGDGGMRVSVRTAMPGVTPAMVDWWFGWHGDAAAKYKLWHPQAHVHVGWRETPPPASAGARFMSGRLRSLMNISAAIWFAARSVSCRPQRLASPTKVWKMIGGPPSSVPGSALVMRRLISAT